MNASDGGFQWNAGGWFGAQLGGTCWMLIAAALVFPRQPDVALTTLAIFAAVNLVGALAWARRAGLRPYMALQGLVIISGLASVAVTFILDSAGEFEGLGVGGSISATAMYVALAFLIPALLLQFYVIERRGRR